jgi:hypothetical protein
MFLIACHVHPSLILARKDRSILSEWALILGKQQQGILTEGEDSVQLGFRTIDLLIKVANFVEKVNNNFNIKRADLN